MVWLIDWLINCHFWLEMTTWPQMKWQLNSLRHQLPPLHCDNGLITYRCAEACQTRNLEHVALLTISTPVREIITVTLLTFKKKKRVGATLRPTERTMIIIMTIIIMMTMMNDKTASWSSVDHLLLQTIVVLPFLKSSSSPSALRRISSGRGHAGTHKASSRGALITLTKGGCDDFILWSARQHFACLH